MKEFLLAFFIVTLTGAGIYFITNKNRGLVKPAVWILSGIFLFAGIVYSVFNYSDFLQSWYFLSRVMITFLAAASIGSFFVGGYNLFLYFHDPLRYSAGIIFFVLSGIVFLGTTFSFIDARKEILNPNRHIPVRYDIIGTSIQCDTARGNIEVTIRCHERLEK